MLDDGSSAPKGARALARLDDAGVLHCVWKGTWHLAESLRGDGDLDVLVHAEHLAAARSALSADGFVRTPRVRPADQPGAEDWFAVEAGAFVHLQLYSQLFVGDLVTGWRRLPPGEGALAGRVRSAAGVWVAPPATEASLLLLRAAAAPPEGSTRGRLARARTLARWRDEWRALLALTSLEDVAAVTRAWLGVEGERSVLAAGVGLDAQGVHRLAAALHALTVPVGDGVLVRCVRTCVLAANRADRRWLRSGRAVRRTLPGGGLHVHLHGDGAPELSADLAAAVAVKFDVLRVRGGPGRRAERARRRGLLVVSSGGAPSPHADLALDASVVGLPAAFAAVWDRVRAGQSDTEAGGAATSTA